MPKLCLLVLPSLVLMMLAGCQSETAEEFTVSGQPLEYWLERQSDSEPQMRARAVRALGNVGPDVPEIVPALIEALADPDPGVRLLSVQALLRFGTAAQDAAPALTQATTDSDEPVRTLAAKALARIQEK